MGPTSMNLAYLFGGAELKGDDSYNDKKELIKLGREGNVIPDLAEFVVDIRPASPDLTAGKVMRECEESAKSHGYEIGNIKLRHQLGAWYTDLTEVKEFVSMAKEITGKTDIGKPGDGGYIDLQMLWEATGRPPALMFGGGEGATAHKPNEHIKIENLIKERDFFKKVLEKHSK